MIKETKRTCYDAIHKYFKNKKSHRSGLLRFQKETVLETTYTVQNFIKDFKTLIKSMYDVMEVFPVEKIKQVISALVSVHTTYYRKVNTTPAIQLCVEKRGGW